MSAAPNPSFLTFQQRLGGPLAQWSAARWQMLCDLRVAVPGIIQSFDPDKQTATVQVSVTENLLDPGTLVPTPNTIPVLVDVPVIMFRAGHFVLTFPVQEGDECLLIFGDNDYGAWWQSGGVQNQVDRRRHDLSDSFAIVGLWSQPNVIENYSTDTVQLRSVDGTKVIEIADAEINIQTTDASDININASGSGTVAVESAAEVNISAPTINISGSTGVNITGLDDIDGKNFLTHTHSGVTTGGGTSGPVT